MKNVIVASVLALAPSIANCAVFNFGAESETSLFNRFSGSFTAFDYDLDGFIRSNEVISFSAEAGQQGGRITNFVSVTDETEDAFFNVNYELGGEFLSSASFGISREFACSSFPGQPADQSREFQKSFSVSAGIISYNSLGAYDGGDPSECSSYSVVNFSPSVEGDVLISATGAAVVPLPASGLLMLAGFLGFGVFRRFKPT